MSTEEEDRARMQLKAAVDVAMSRITENIGPGIRFAIGKSADPVPVVQKRHGASVFANWEIVFESDDPRLVDKLHQVLVIHFGLHYASQYDGHAVEEAQGDCRCIYMAFT